MPDPNAAGPARPQADSLIDIDAVRPLSSEMRARLDEMSDLEKQMKGFALTTAEFIYHLPDAPSVLNTFVWQKYDIRPDFPVLFDFIHFWKREIEAPLNAVVFAHCARDVHPNDWRHAKAIYEIRGH